MSKASPTKNQGVPENLRGTYAGFGSGPMVDYLTALGVTSIELLPIHTFINDSNLLEKEAYQLLGLQHHRLLRARSTLRVGCSQQFARIQGDGGPPACRRPRSHP